MEGPRPPPWGLRSHPQKGWMQPGDPPWESGVAQTPSDVNMQGPRGEQMRQRGLWGGNTQLKTRRAAETHAVFRTLLTASADVNRDRPQTGTETEGGGSRQNCAGTLALTLSNSRPLSRCSLRLRTGTVPISRNCYSTVSRVRGKALPKTSASGRCHLQAGNQDREHAGEDDPGLPDEISGPTA